MNRFVLDASVSLAWFIDRQIAPYALRVRQLLLAGNRAVVPPLWRLEIANGFIVAERRGVLTSNETAEALQTFQILLAQAIEENAQSLSLPRVIETARQFQLTAYDAEYLDMARVQQLPLATLDRKLEESAIKAGVQLLK